jgi:1,2-dihydroxy-3-keto-5-methylthiopentene dioxygenase
MATLRLTNGTVYHQLTDIQRELSPLKIQLHQWPLGDDPRLQELLAQDQLQPPDQAELLGHLDHYFEQLRPQGYQTCDLIVIHPDIPGLDAMLAKFDRCHTHADDEVRYIVAGSGIFGFVRPDGSQVELTVTAAEYINVPAGTEHWFYLTEQRRVKAVRYFIDTTGWVPQYTDTPIAFLTPVTA